MSSRWINIYKLNGKECKGHETYPTKEQAEIVGKRAHSDYFTYVRTEEIKLDE